MKAFFLIVMLVFAFFIVASSSMAQVDLTPNTPPAAVEPLISSAPLIAVQPQVVQIQDTAPQATNLQVPVTGSSTCPSPYTVQAGDSLSLIAARCDVTVGEIRLANPQITNINMIYSGQQITMPGASAAQPVAETIPLPVTGKDDAGASTTTGETIPMPVTGNVNVIQAGTNLQITGRNFPVNAPVNVGLGTQGGSYSIMAAGVTDATGTVVVSINLPADADPNTQWVVVMASATNPVVQGSSKPFYIQAP